MRLFDVSQQLTQPDGRIINCYASGDEYFNYLHDKNGYIIIQDEVTGFYKYANYINGILVPSQYIVESNVNDKVFITNNYESLVTIKDIKLPLNKGKYTLPYIYKSEQDPVFKSSFTPNQGNVSNIVVFIRFSDEVEFIKLIESYNTMFNNSTDGAISIKNYYKEVSYQKLSISSYFYPITSTTQVVSYQDQNQRAYYQPYNVVTNPIGYKNEIEQRDREHTLLKNAVDFISPQVNPAINIDIDNDGIVDSICFIIKGGADGWSSLLWPHQWSLYTQNAYINGKKVLEYIFLLDAELDISVTCHEINHAIGAPDLYHYNFDGAIPVGPWDIMEYILSTPQHTTAYLKFRYLKWIDDIPEIKNPGTYTLNPLLSQENNAYKFRSPLSLDEYFVVEYRKRDSVFENSLPGSGLIVYRINTLQDNKGNAGGPPDEVYVYRPEGTTISNGQINNAYLTSDVGRSAIGGHLDPLFLSTGQPTDIRLFNITSASDKISFDIAFSSNKPDLSIKKVGSPNTIILGNVLEYTIEAINTGSIAATNVVVIDTLPNSLEFLSTTMSKGGYTSNNNVITFNIGELVPDEKVTISIKSKTLKAETVINNAVITASNSDSKSVSTTNQVIKNFKKLTTGDICNCAAKKLIITVKNNTDESVNIPLNIITSNRCSIKDNNKMIKVNPNSCVVFELRYLLRCYRLTFDQVLDGVAIEVYESNYSYCCKKCKQVRLTEV